MVEKAIFNILSSDLGVSALVGLRIFPVYIPQGESKPAITYQQLGGPRDHTTDGASGFVESSFQVQCWAETYAGADDLADKVRLAMDGISGTYADVVIHCIHLVNEVDVPAIEPENEALNEFGKSLDFTLWHKEA